MKWKKKNYKIVKRFLLLPYEMDGEFRWLEWAYIDTDSPLGWFYGKWITWSTKEIYDAERQP